MSMVIKGGRVIDPASKRDEVCDILVKDGRISEIGKNLVGEKTIDAKGLIVCPGFIDMHVHLREPGREDKETIATCSRSAAKGGMTTIVGMPNSTPIADDQTVVGYVVSKAAKEAVVNVFPVGAMTVKSESSQMAQVGDLIRAGAVAVSDDGWPVKEAGLMLKALQYLETYDIPYISHSEDESLADGGVMHEGDVSTELGLPGIPSEAEAACIAREIVLVGSTKAHVHFTHISTKESIALIRDAKKRKLNVTCDTTPNYFTLTDEAVRGYDPMAKVNPPLRSEDHRKAILEGLKDGTIDCITTDHAPHLRVEKMLEFEHCANGIVGLETSIPLSLQLVKDKVISMDEMVRRYTINPANILKLPKGTLKKGADADITIIDPKKKFLVDKEKFETKGRNTPYNGWELTGCAVMTIVDGRIVFDGEKIIS